MRRRYLTTYDISDDKRRNRVFKILTGCGDHVQFSVFVCELSDREKAELIAQLEQSVHCRADQVLLLDLGPADSPLEIGRELEGIGHAYVPPGRTLIV